MENGWRVYGPYIKRTGARMYATEVWFKDGVRKDVSLGSVGSVETDVVHVEGDIPVRLIEDLAHLVWYVQDTNLSKRRIANPVKRLLRLFGLQHYTEERL